MMVEKVPDSTYEMVGGLDKQIKEIKEVIELPVKHPELFDALGIAQPKGVLLYGPPGTGKTLLARAVASQLDANFLKVVSSAIVDKYIGRNTTAHSRAGASPDFSLRRIRQINPGDVQLRQGPPALHHLHGRD